MINNPQPSQLTLTGDAKAIRHLEQAILSGKHWYIALLEAIGLWKKAEEDYDGRHYCYLVAEEAFERILSVTNAVKERIAEDSLELQRNFNDKYRVFLEKELERMERERRYEEERAKDGGGLGLFF